MYHIFLVDDHPLLLKAYAALIGREPDMVVCGQARTAEEALQLIPQMHMDIALVDVSLNGSSGIELVEQLLEDRPELAIVVVSGHEESIYAEVAINAGARDYVMKRNTQQIIPTIRRVLAGLKASQK